jgi:Zn-dependent protease
VENYWHLGRWFRIPVAMHWTVLLVFPWMWLIMQSWTAALIGGITFCVLLVAHEFGHAAMARWRGLGVHGITLNGLHGETAHDYPRNRRDDIAIAWSGVGAQFLLLLLGIGLRLGMDGVHSMGVWLVMAPVVDVLIRWNLFLIVVALLPIGPMDGHRAWKLIPLLRDSLRRKQGGGKVVKLDAARRRKLEQSSQQAAADIISKLGKKK